MRVGTIKDDTKDESGAPEDDENGAEPEVAPGGASSSKNTGKRSAASSEGWVGSAPVKDSIAGFSPLANDGTPLLVT